MLSAAAVAVMEHEPALSPVMMPADDTEQTVASEDDQLTNDAATAMLSNFTVAVPVLPTPTPVESRDKVTARDRFSTSKVTLAVDDSYTEVAALVTLTLHFPTATGVMVPPASMEQTPTVEEVQVSAPPDGLVAAAAVSVSPISRLEDTVGALMATVRARFVIVMLRVSGVASRKLSFPGTLARIVQVPIARPVTTPDAASTEQVDAVAEDHATVPPEGVVEAVAVTVSLMRRLAPADGPEMLTVRLFLATVKDVSTGVASA